MATQNTFILEVSWNGDSDFSDSNENITAYTLAWSCARGRDYASQLTGRSVTGRLQATLDNRDGRFSSFNASSPLYGSILPGRRVRIRSTAPTAATLWAGFLDRIEPAVNGGMPIATLYASGPFVKLGGPNAKVSPSALQDVQTGAIIDAILDAAGWPGGDRIIDSGDVEVGDWYIEEVEALAAMQEIEETEQGFLYEGLAWDVVFEERYNRSINHVTSEATFSDVPSAALQYLIEITQSDPLREIFNEFIATVTPYDDPAALAVLWRLEGETISLAAGESRTIIAKAQNADYVLAWTTPVAGTDVTAAGIADGDIGISVVKRALTMDITLTNNGATAGDFTLIQARGTGVSALNPYKISKSDATSQTAYGRRTYPLASPWYRNAAYAEGTAEYVIARQKDPRPILSLPLSSGTDDTLFAQAVGLALSDRITARADGLLTMLGINNEFYIEAIAHEWQTDALLRTTFDLSPAEANPHWFLMDSSLMDGADVLAY